MASPVGTFGFQQLSKELHASARSAVQPGAASFGVLCGSSLEIWQALKKAWGLGFVGFLINIGFGVAGLISLGFWVGLRLRA